MTMQTTYRAFCIMYKDMAYFGNFIYFSLSSRPLNFQNYVSKRNIYNHTLGSIQRLYDIRLVRTS